MIVAAVAVFFVLPVYAMEVKASLDEIAHASDLVVVGDVVETSSRFNEAQTMIFTDVILSNVDVVHASSRSTQVGATRIVLTHAGGQVGIRGVSVSGAPHFEVGQRYLLFLLDDGKTYANPLVGGSQGQFRIVQDAETDVPFPLTMSGKAVLGVIDGDVVASRNVVDRDRQRRHDRATTDQNSSGARFDQVPLASDPQSRATAGPPSETDHAATQPLSLPRFIEQLQTILDRPASGEKVLRFGPGDGSFYTDTDGTITKHPLPSRSSDELSAGIAAWRDALSKSLAGNDDATERSGSAGFDGERGGVLGYCGYHDLHLTMQQLPESWWEWGSNNASMWDWNQVMDVYRYIASDGYYGDNNENEFCAYVNAANLSSVYGYSWGSGIAMCITWWVGCQCCEIVQSDILWNAAYSWTNNWEWSIGNGSVIYLATTNMHELGHSWGMQRGSYVETYDYDQPTVMHPYYHSLVESGRGIHRPEAYCVRRLYDDQTSILSTKDIGVESYWASNGLHNAYTSPTTVHPGNTVSLYGVTVENISFAAVSDLRIRFWLSTNRIISTGDHQLGGYWYWGSFGGEQYNVGNYSMTVPTIPAGEYYVGAMVTKDGFGGDDYSDNNTTSFLNKLTVLPASPANVSASDGIYTDRIRVTWSSVAGASGYDIYRRSCSNCTAYKIGSSSTTTYDDMASLSPLCSYYYFVKATSPWGSSYSSSQNLGYRKFQTPSGLSATDNQPNRIRLTWSSVYGATNYSVLRSVCNDPMCIFVPIGSTSSTLFDDTTASPGRVYYYFIRASNTCGTSPNSASTGGSMALPAPTGVSASDGTLHLKVRVTWGAVTNATSYDVWRGTAPAYISMIGSAAGTTFDDTTAVEGTTYYYFVAARSSIGAGVLSAYDTGFHTLALIFADDFEGGGLGAWTLVKP